MKINKKLLLPLITLVTLLALVFQGVPAVFAANNFEEAIVGGTISTVNPDGTITVIDGGGVEYILTLPEGTDPTTIIPGTRVELVATVNEDGTTTVVSYTIADRKPGYYCDQSTDLHPAGEKIAIQMGVDYATVQSMFCNDFLGFGEIKNLLSYSAQFGIDPAVLLSARLSGLGWGQVKQELGISTNGKPENTGNGKPENPGNSGNPNKPDHPDNPNKPDHPANPNKPN